MKNGKDSISKLGARVLDAPFNLRATKTQAPLPRKTMHLCIDVQKDSCDPAFFQKLIDRGAKCNPAFIGHLNLLDQTAQHIARFAETLRSKMETIWVYSKFPQLEDPNDPDNPFNNQGAPHHVIRRPDDLTLQKGKYGETSPVPENRAFFEDLKAQGVTDFILTGLYTDICILDTAKDLQDMGFNVTVVEDLTQSAKPETKADGIKALRAMGTTLLSQSRILNPHINTSHAAKSRRPSILP